MGVDFKWEGSASYPRYYDEVEKIATQCFGATLDAKYIEDAGKVQKSLLNPTYMLGSVNERDNKFIFPEKTSPIIVQFCKKPVGECYDAGLLWQEFRAHPEIEDISSQIWNEVKQCAEYGELYCVN